MESRAIRQDSVWTSSLFVILCELESRVSLISGGKAHEKLTSRVNVLELFTS